VLLVEIGATVPNWLEHQLEHYDVACLEQGASESYAAFVERSSSWLSEHTNVNTVVVALDGHNLQDLEERVHRLGRSLAGPLSERPRARLLFGAPADVPERQRRQILGLTAELAQPGPGNPGTSACIVGAHFSANPPSSSKIRLG
jgi:hypothetical protein